MAYGDLNYTTEEINADLKKVHDKESVVDDAPSDGKQYGRKNNEWSVIEAGGTQYLDLFPLLDNVGDPVSTVTDEFLAELKKAYEEKYSVALADGVNTPLNIAYAEGTYTLAIESFVGNSSNYAKYLYKIEISETDKSIQISASYVNLTYDGAGTKALTDNGQYAEFAKPSDVNNKADKIKIEDHRNEELGGTLSLELKPNKMYLFQNSSKLNLTLSNDGDSYVDEFIFEIHTSSMFQITLSLPDSVKWVGGEPPVLEEAKIYQFSIVNNLAVYAAF